MEPTCPAYHPDLDLPALLATIDAIVAYDLLPNLRALAPRLRWVQLFHAGVDGVWQPYLADPDLVVTTVSGTHPIAMTEFVLGFEGSVERWYALTFMLSVHRNATPPYPTNPPPGSTNTMPGGVLWTQMFKPGQYRYQLMQPYPLSEHSPCRQPSLYTE
jgi:hypothetical protein